MAKKPRDYLPSEKTARKTAESPGMVYATLPIHNITLTYIRAPMTRYFIRSVSRVNLTGLTGQRAAALLL